MAHERKGGTEGTLLAMLYALESGEIDSIRLTSEKPGELIVSASKLWKSAPRDVSGYTAGAHRFTREDLEGARNHLAIMIPLVELFAGIAKQARGGS